MNPYEAPVATAQAKAGDSPWRTLLRTAGGLSLVIGCMMVGAAGALANVADSPAMVRHAGSWSLVNGCGAAIAILAGLAAIGWGRAAR